MKTTSFCLPNIPVIVRAGMTLLLVLLITLIFIEPSFAGTADAGTEFKPIYDKLKTWVEGFLGKSIALLAFMVGLFYGAIKQNFIMALGGVGIAIMISVIPGVMEKLVGAVI